MPAPSWLSLLSPLPGHAVVEKKPVASAEQLANNAAGPIAGWQSVTINLSEPAYGLRHVLITLDEHGDLLAGGDHVMFVRDTTPDGLGARSPITKAAAGDLKSPTGGEIAALRRIIDDVLMRLR